PAESDIAHEIGSNIDPQAINAARKTLREALAQALGARSEAIYASLSTVESYSPDAVSAGRRALKNACLDLLSMNGSKDAVTRVYRQFASADNMTDRFAALAVLTQHDVPERERALAEFHEHFRNHPLVIDKWLALHATLTETGALSRVHDLHESP